MKQALTSALILFAVLIASLRADAADVTTKYVCTMNPNVMDDVFIFTLLVTVQDSQKLELSQNSTFEIKNNTVGLRSGVLHDTLSKWGLSSIKKIEDSVLLIEGQSSNRVTEVTTQKSLRVDLADGSALLRQSLQFFNDVPNKSAPLFQATEGRCQVSH